MIRSSVLFFAVITCYCWFDASMVSGQQPPTVATVNVDSRAFLDLVEVSLSAEEVVFVEIQYDTYAPLVLTMFNSVQALDTEFGLFDFNGNLIAENDDAFFGSGRSEIRQSDLVAGNYFLAMGLDDVTFGPDFQATSSSNINRDFRFSCANTAVP